jgi:thymidine kinase
MTSSHLKIVFGPMFSGKTSEILKTIDIYLETKHDNIVLINSEIDVRPNLNNLYNLSTHSKTSKDIHDERIIRMKTEKLLNIDKKVFLSERKIDLIIIDECQFFEDLIPFVNFLLENNHNVVCYGLIANYKLEKFGQLSDLICKADEVLQKYAVCKKCLKEKSHNNSKAAHTTKISLSNDVLEVGAKGQYEARCREHHSV